MFYRMVKIILVTMALATTGCAYNKIPTIVGDSLPQKVNDNTIKISFGIPFLLGIEASAARLNDEWLVTAAHNKIALPLSMRDDVYYHPTCDIALIRYSGEMTTKVGLIYVGQQVSHVGYPAYMPLSYIEGVYRGDVLYSLSNKTCSYSVSDGGLAGGMSGGGVYNTNGELVGINSLFIKDIKLTNPSEELEKINGKTVPLFVPLYGVRDWMEEITGVDFFKEQ